jgi:DNA-binding transcriptional LysR family regulator
MPLHERIGQRLKLRDLYILRTTAQLGSMGKAAAQLAVSQPAISKAVTDLEHVLGVRLLDRSRQGVEPTVYGASLLKWSGTIFDNLRQGVDEIEFLADPTAGELRIGTTEAMTAALLPAVIDRLSRQHPRMLFKVLQAPIVADQYHDLRERNIDLILGVLDTPIAGEALNVEILFEDSIVIVAGPNSKWHRRRKIDPTELVDEPWALSHYETGFAGRIVKEAFRAKGLNAPRQIVTSNAIQLNTSLAAADHFLTARLASNIRLSGKRLSVKALPVTLQMPPVHIGIVTLKDRTISPAAGLFMECARKIAKPFAKSSKGFGAH